MWPRRKRRGVLLAPIDDISISFWACSAVGQRGIQGKSCLLWGNVSFVFDSSGIEQKGTTSDHSALHPVVQHQTAVPKKKEGYWEIQVFQVNWQKTSKLEVKLRSSGVWTIEQLGCWCFRWTLSSPNHYSHHTLSSSVFVGSHTSLCSPCRLESK